LNIKLLWYLTYDDNTEEAGLALEANACVCWLHLHWNFDWSQSLSSLHLECVATLSCKYYIKGLKQIWPPYSKAH